MAPRNLVARLRTLMSLTPDDFRVAGIPCYGAGKTSRTCGECWEGEAYDSMMHGGCNTPQRYFNDIPRIGYSNAGEVLSELELGYYFRCI
jgi:hypothetical protein